MNLNLEFAEPVQWNQENEYSINDVVFNGTEAYTAIDYVPSGTALSNATYWKKTGKYIRTSNLADGSVTTPKLTDGSVTTPKLADGAITVDILPDLITSQGQGESVTAADASYLASLTVDGKAVQDGTPTPSAPVPVDVVALNWNQLLRKENISLPDTNYGVTYTDNHDGSITVNGTANGGTPNAAIYNVRVISGHKYLFRSCPNGGAYETYCSYLTGQGAANNIDSGNGTIATFQTSGIITAVIARVANGKTANNLKFYFQLFDLTLMFGAGNEPTVAEFEAMYPEAYYPYDAGSTQVLLKTGTSYTPINLNGNVLSSLPDGTKDVLTVDSVGHVVMEKRVGVVDSSYTSLSHPYFSETRNIWVTNDKLAKPPTISATVPNMLCTHAYPVPQSASWVPGTCSIYSLQDANAGKIAFSLAVDMSMDTVEKMWTAYPDLKVYYPLATLQTIDLGYIDMPAIPDGSTISITAQVTPTITASWWVDMASSVAEAVRSMRDDLVEKFDGEITTLASSLATVESGAASANYTIGSYLVMENVLYKVTSAIASGESVVPGTNVTATTVMAEILALTS